MEPGSGITIPEDTVEDRPNGRRTLWNHFWSSDSCRQSTTSYRSRSSQNLLQSMRTSWRCITATLQCRG